jgi:CheY-like chemotaxis protein
VQVAADGESGAQLIMRLQPDIAFVDIGLPRLDGYGVATRVRQVLSRDRVRLVAMTGFGQPSDRERSKAAGYDEHLVKPPELEALKHILSLGKN